MMALFASDALLVSTGQTEQSTAVGTKEQRPWRQSAPSYPRNTIQNLPILCARTGIGVQ